MEEMYVRKEFLLANGLSQLPNASMTDDLSPYDYFDGNPSDYDTDLADYDDNLGDDMNMEFSFASGSRRRAKRRLKKARKGTSPRQRRIGRVADRRQERVADRRSRKEQEARVQQKAIQDVQKQAQADAQLLAQLTQPTQPTNLIPTPTKTMSRNTKIGLTIGGVAVALFVGFVIYKKMKK